MACFSTHVFPRTWLIDSGACNHMTGNYSCFSPFTSFHPHRKIILGDGRSTTALGQGIHTIFFLIMYYLSHLFLLMSYLFISFVSHYFVRLSSLHVCVFFRMLGLSKSFAAAMVGMVYISCSKQMGPIRFQLQLPLRRLSNDIPGLVILTCPS